MYKEVKLLDHTDAAYIAGIIDGEGTVTLSRRHKSENRQLVISISNTERPSLNMCLIQSVPVRSPVKEPTNLTTPQATHMPSPIGKPWHC
jgi:hypothetical protein